jgi:nucleotide-binding universal stress UspA family protein
MGILEKPSLYSGGRKMQKKILFAVDGSDRCFDALSGVGELLKDQSDCDLELFHSVQELSKAYNVEADGVDASRVFASRVEKIGNAILEKSKGVLLASGFPTERTQVKVELGSEDPAEDILRRAHANGISTIALGRRGLSKIGRFLLGSVSNKVAHYCDRGTVWIVDTPIEQSRKVLLAVEGVQDCLVLTRYTGEFFSSIPGLEFTLLHLVPPIPPAFWDDGHILSPEERQDRKAYVEKWRSEWMKQAEEYMGEGRDFLVQKGVPPENVTITIVPTREGITSDLLNEIENQHYEIVLIGKKSFHKKTPYLLGNRANKILHKARGIILCLLDFL